MSITTQWGQISFEASFEFRHVTFLLKGGLILEKFLNSFVQISKKGALSIPRANLSTIHI